MITSVIILVNNVLALFKIIAWAVILNTIGYLKNRINNAFVKLDLLIRTIK